MHRINTLFCLVCRAVRALTQLILVGIFLAAVCFAGFVAVKGSQPVGVVGAGSPNQTANISDMNYWQFISVRLEVSRQTPASCHRTRLVFLAVALPVYPSLYTVVALYPESILARHMQPSPLIPETIGWRDIPETWWNLVKEVSWLAFALPLWDFTPAIGERVGLDEMCYCALILR